MNVDVVGTMFVAAATSARVAAVVRLRRENAAPNAAAGVKNTRRE